NGCVLQFEQAEHLDAEELTQRIIDSLEKHSLEFQNNLLGQSYEGTAVMSGKHRGVQTRVKQLQKLYVFMSGSVVHQKWLQIQVLRIAEQCNIYTETVPKGKKKLSSKLEATCVMSTVGIQSALNGKVFQSKNILPVAIPVSTAACEHRFSCLKLIKTHLRSSTAED
ncbi:hypothetical protein Z043_126081, partial [Scleropages formosus]